MPILAYPRQLPGESRETAPSHASSQQAGHLPHPWPGLTQGPRAPLPPRPCIPPGSRRYVVMQTAETQQLGDSGHKATSKQDFRKSLRDLPL